MSGKVITLTQEAPSYGAFALASKCFDGAYYIETGLRVLGDREKWHQFNNQIIAALNETCMVKEIRTKEKLTFDEQLGIAQDVAKTLGIAYPWIENNFLKE